MFYAISSLGATFRGGVYVFSIAIYRLELKIAMENTYTPLETVFRIVRGGTRGEEMRILAPASRTETSCPRTADALCTRQCIDGGSRRHRGAVCRAQATKRPAANAAGQEGLQREPGKPRPSWQRRPWSRCACPCRRCARRRRTQGRPRRRQPPRAWRSACPWHRRWQGPPWPPRA